MNEIDSLATVAELDAKEVVKDIDHLVEEYKALRAEVQRLWADANPDLTTNAQDDFGYSTEERENAYRRYEEANERLARFKQDNPEAVAEYERWKAKQSKLLVQIHHPYDVGSSDEEQ